MTYQELELLSRVYNTLLLINTKGEDTIYMSECLQALKKFVLTKKAELEQPVTENIEEV